MLLQAPAEEWKAEATKAVERALSASDALSRTHTVPMPDASGADDNVGQGEGLETVSERPGTPAQAAELQPGHPMEGPDASWPQDTGCHDNAHVPAGDDTSLWGRLDPRLAPGTISMQCLFSNHNEGVKAMLCFLIHSKRRAEHVVDGIEQYMAVCRLTCMRAYYHLAWMQC